MTTNTTDGITFEDQERHVLFEGTPAHLAVQTLATIVAKRLGSGDPDGDGLLEYEHLVSTRGLFGHTAVTTYPTNGGATTIVLSDDASPLEQLRALLEQLGQHCLAPYASGNRW